MLRRRSAACWITSFCLALTLSALGEEGSEASANTPMGAVISNPELATTGGGKRAPQGAEAANVLVFFRPDKDASVATLKGLAPCEKRTAGKSVRWTAIVSDKYPAEQVKAAQLESGIAMPILVDAGDALYVELGIAQLPAVAITDKDHKLVHFQPFTKLNFCELVDGRVRLVIKEITDADFEKIQNPSSTKIGGEASVAGRHVKMAEAYLKAGSPDKAVEQAKIGIEKAPELAAAHAMLGSALAASGDCKAAKAAFEQALKLDPADARAVDGKKGCEGK
jgi:tetratricopeptide (TPR) repeat protein